MPNEEQRSVDLSLLDSDGFRRGEEGLSTESDGLLSNVFKDGSLGKARVRDLKSAKQTSRGEDGGGGRGQTSMKL